MVIDKIFPVIKSLSLSRVAYHFPAINGHTLVSPRHAPEICAMGAVFALSSAIGPEGADLLPINHASSEDGNRGRTLCDAWTYGEAA